MNLVHAGQSDLFNIDFSIILPSTPRSYKWCFLPEVSPPQFCMHLSSPPYVPHEKTEKTWKNAELLVMSKPVASMVTNVI